MRCTNERTYGKESGGRKPAGVLALAALVMLVWSSARMLAQAGLGTILGRVTDPTGAIVQKAQVRIINAGTGVVTQIQTNDAGEYNSGPTLVPGEYRVEVIQTGFGQQDVAGVSVANSETATIDVTLTLGKTTTAVTVEAKAQLLDRTDADQAVTLEKNLLQSLPYAERSSLSSILLTPTVLGDPGSEATGQIASENPGIYTGYIIPGVDLSIGGAWPGRSTVLIDGSDVTQASYPRQGISVSGDLIQETTTIVTGAPAQYGATMGGVVVQSTRAGSNEFHGGVTWTHADPSTEAWSYVKTFAPDTHQNFLGAYLGGPVRIPKLYNGRNKTFFYAAYEPSRLSSTLTEFAYIPLDSELQGHFANSLSFINTTILRNQGYAAALAAPRTGGLWNQFPTNANGFPIGARYQSTSQYTPIANDDVSAQLALNPVAQYINSLYPTTAHPGPYIRYINPGGYWNNAGQNVYLYRGVTSQDNRWSTRIDQSFGLRDHLFVRYSTEPITSQRFFGLPVSDPGTQTFGDDAHARDISFNESHFFTEHITNQFRALYMRDNQQRLPPASSLTKDYGASLGLTPAAAGKGFPHFGAGSYNMFMGNSGFQNEIDQNYQYGDDVTWSLGNHEVSFGVDARWLQSNQYQTSGIYGGSYTFNGSQTTNGSTGGNGLAEMDLGLIQGFTNTPVLVPDYYRWRYYGLYVQDSYRATPKLTLSYGLRWEVETPEMEKHNLQGTFLASGTGTLNGQSATGVFCFSGSCGLPKTLWPTNWHGFEPRLGVAYTPRDWVVFHASFAMFRIPLSGYSNTPSLNFNTSSQSIGGVNGGVVANSALDFITNPIGTITPATAALNNGGGPYPYLPSNLTLPYISQSNAVPYSETYGANLQFSISPNLVVQTGYVGMTGVHLISSYAPPQNFPNLNSMFTQMANGTNFSSVAPNPYGIQQNGSVLTETKLQSLLPYQNYFNQYFPESFNRSGSSSYNAFYVTGEKRLSYGLSMVGSFTWAKAMDTVGSDPAMANGGIEGGAVPQSPLGLTYEHSLSNFDIPARGTAGGTYRTPQSASGFLGTHGRFLASLVTDWSVSANANDQSGYPLAPQLGGSGYWITNSAGYATVIPTGINLRPDVVPGTACITSNWRQNFSNNAYFNSSHFAVPGSLGHPAFGDASRTLGDCRSPRLVTFDANLQKVIPLSKDDRVRFMFGANAVNVLNHPNFAIATNPSTVFGSFNSSSVTNPSVPPFTVSTSFGFASPGNQRLLQLTSRLTF
jgi:hypothetical protein